MPLAMGSSALFLTIDAYCRPMNGKLKGMSNAATAADRTMHRKISAYSHWRKS